jgi:hypothetical protein
VIILHLKDEKVNWELTGQSLLCCRVGRAVCATDWSEAFVLQTGQSSLCYRLGRAVCVTDWAEPFVLQTGQSRLCYRLRRDVCAVFYFINATFTERYTQ